MRVAFVTPWEHTCGVADYAKSLVVQHEAQRSAAIQGPSGAGEEIDLQIVPLLPHFRSGFWDALRHRSEDLRYYRQLGKQASQADLVHVQFQYPLFGGYAPWKLKFSAFMNEIKVPVVLTMHELDHSPLPRGTGMNFWQRQHYFHNASIVTWPQIKAIIVHTRELVEPLIDLLVDPAIIHVQPMPVPEIETLPSTDVAKARLGLSGRRVLSVLGFVVKRKGYPTAISALAELPEDYVLAIVGGRSEFDRSGYCESLITQWAESLLKNSVAHYEKHGDPGGVRAVTVDPRRLSPGNRLLMTLTLPEDDFRLWLAATDVVLAPFESMTGSASLALALAAGKPIVGSDIPGLREMNEIAPCLDLVPQGDFGALARAVRSIAEDEVRRESLLSGVRQYRERCGVRTVASATVKLYDSVLGTNSG